MPSIFRKNTTGWVEILSVFRKNTTGWVEILNAYRKNTTGWVKVFARSQIPGIVSFPKVRNSSGTDINNTTVIARVGDTLTGYRGNWSNSPTAYEDRWYFNQYAGGGSYGPFSPAQTNTTLVTNLSHDGYYVVYQVRATNASGSSEYVTSSNEARVVKYAPVSLSISNLNGPPVVGGTLTAGSQNSLWRNTTSISGDTYPNSFEYEWSYSDGTILQFTSSDSYIINSNDVGKTIRVRVTGTNTGGSATSGYTPSGVVTAPYSFNFGNILYVGSNGYITLDQAPSPAIATLPAGNGRTINIWNDDLVNYRIQEYSDSSNYHLYFRAYAYQNPLVQSSANALDYQIKFYTGQLFCDVYLVRKGSNVSEYLNDPGYYANGLFQTSGFSGIWGAGSFLRVYFDGTIASTSGISWTSIPDSAWKSVSTSNIDEGYVAVTTSANQQNVVTPTITMLQNSGVSPSSGTINWTSTNQESFSSSGTISGSGSTGTSVTNNTLSAETTYNGTVTVTSSTGHTASANYSLTTPASTFTMPNIIGMTKTTGGNAIVAAGFYWENDYPYTTNDINLDQIIFAQTPEAGFVGVPQNAYFDYYNYVASSITYGACTAYGSPYYSNSTYECYGNYSYYYTDNYYYQRKQILSNGTWNGSYDYDCPTTSVRTYGNFIQVNGQCGYSPPAPSPTITSGPFISWGSGNNFTLSASASNATNLEFQVQYSSSQTGSPSTGSATYFFGASSGGGTTGSQASNRSWARTRVRANNSSTGLSSAFSGYTGWA